SELARRSLADVCNISVRPHTLLRFLFVMIWSLLSILSASRVMRRFLQVKLSIFTAQPNTALTASDLHPVFRISPVSRTNYQRHVKPSRETKFRPAPSQLAARKPVFTPKSLPVVGM